MLSSAVIKVLKMCNHGKWNMGHLIQAPLKPVQCHPLVSVGIPTGLQIRQFWQNIEVLTNMYLKAIISMALQIWAGGGLCMLFTWSRLSLFFEHFLKIWMWNFLLTVIIIIVFSILSPAPVTPFLKSVFSSHL